jgi:Reverse transcriptase (RNA-dependent DNA polymerase)/Endonuclease-reverse transcriptase
LTELHDLLYTFEYNVIAISESWLTPLLSNGILDPRGNYTIYRRDRVSRAGGGVCIFISNDLPSYQIGINLTVFSDVELVGCELIIGDVSINVFCFYSAPNADRIRFTRSLECFKSVLEHDSLKTFLIFGDFNLPNIDWDFSSTAAGARDSEFIDFCLNYGLSQINRQPTRGNNLLDLVLINDPLLVSEISLCPPFGTSDHDSLLVNIVFPRLLDGVAQTFSEHHVKQPSKDKVHYYWSSADWQGCADYCSKVCWRSIFSDCRTANDCWLLFCNVMNQCLADFVPFKVLSVTGSNTSVTKNKKRYSKNVRKLIVKKKNIWISMKRKQINTSKVLAKYKKCAQLIKQTINSNELSHEAKVIESNNVGAIFKHIKSRLTHKTGIAPLRDSNRELVFDNLAKAELMNSHFVKMGTVDNGELPNVGYFSDSGNSIASAYFDTCEIIKVISKLKTNSAPGPDGLPPILYKSLKYQLAEPLSIMFLLFFQYGQLPDEWKTGIVKPIFKAGNSSDPNNYRPISLTCVCCKIFETIVKNHLIEYLLTNSIISKAQHGFISNHSTSTNLLESLNDWTKLLEQKKLVKVLYIDFEKAFDKVSVPKLLLKLKAVGITGLLFKCIESFLSDRKQCVQIEAAQSRYLPVISGVPQGSVLGPFLFLLFINDLPEILDESFYCKLFADDLKAYSDFSLVDDNHKFQCALNRLLEWSDRWQLNFSVGKCGSLLIRGNSNFIDTQDLFIGDNTLNAFDSVKDLGVFVDSRLDFSVHIDKTISKAKQRVYLLLKSFKNRDVKLMIFAFKVYILPLLMYCSPIWSPVKLGDIDRIENVQRSFTKKLNGLKEKSYSERLLICDLPSLELRRIRDDLVLCFKIVNNLIDLDVKSFFQFEKSVHCTRGHMYKLRIPMVKNNIRKNFFAIRIIPVWNSLPQELVSLSSCVVFKRQLMCIDLSKFISRDHDLFESIR